MIAIITGITGQDGSYLAKFLLEKGYKKIIGLTRNNKVLDKLSFSFLDISDKIEFIECDLSIQKDVQHIIEKYMPDEIYNLAAQSSVGLSFDQPTETFTFNTHSVINLLESIKIVSKKIRFYQASSSEMFGNVKMANLPIKESLLFHPVSPYGISKASAHWIAVNYREAYGLYTSCGILFNHESTLRKPNFVIKKIVNNALKIKEGELDFLTLGNLAVNRDWGYAPKYVEAMWLSLQQDKPDDYIVCSGNLSSLQEIVLKTFTALDIDIEKHLRLNQKYMRSLDLSVTYGDNSKAKQNLGWNYDMDTNQLIKRLIEDEIKFINFINNAD